MEYVTAKRAAEMWGRNPTVVQSFCRRGMIPGAIKGKGGWLVPAYDSPPVSLPRRERLVDSERREIARLAHSGRNKAEIARAYGVGRQTVYRMMEEYPPEG